MAAILNGWMGYGTGFSSGSLVEPVDQNYARHPFSLEALDDGVARSGTGGTVGPASQGWGSLLFCAVFDAVQNGNMLFWMPLERPVPVATSGTLTTGRNAVRLLFPGLRNIAAGCSWPAGAVIGEAGHQRPVTAGVALQFSGGMFSVQAAVFGASVNMSAIPGAQPVAGSGLLWNNGGVISIA